MKSIDFQDKMILRIEAKFKSKYESGSCEYINKAKAYHSRLFNDYNIKDDLNETSHFERLSRHFHVLDDKMFMFYSENELEAFISAIGEAKELSCSPDIKQKIIDDFNNQFKDAGECDVKFMNNFIRERMNIYSVQYIDGMSQSQPRLAQMLTNIEQVDESDDTYWQIPVDRIEYGRDRSDDVEVLDIFNLDIKTEPKEKIDYSQNNDYIGKFDDFRITRRMKRGNASDLLRNMLAFAFIVDGDTFTRNDWEKLKYAVKMRLDNFDDEIDVELEGIVDRDNDMIKIKPELN